MKRQNSIPQPLRPSQINNHRRKCSHDSLQCYNTKSISLPGGLTHLIEHQNHEQKSEGLSPILVTKLESRSYSHSLKKVTLTEEVIPFPGTLSPSSSMNTISFGIAMAANAHFRKISADCESDASTSRRNENNETAVTEIDAHQTGLFILQMADGSTVSNYCHQPIGEQADQILLNINTKLKEKLRKFIEQEKRIENCNDNYVWIKNDKNGSACVLSMRQLENHFNSAEVKRVKWRYSVPITTIYRYSVPVITTKFRLRIMHFLSQNYRCCILFVWCFVILFISVGIVLSVIFGSTPYMNSSLRRNMTTGYILQR